MEEYRQTKPLRTWWLVVPCIIIMSIVAAQFFIRQKKHVVIESDKGIFFSFKGKLVEVANAKKTDETNSFVQENDCKVVVDNIKTNDIEAYIYNRETAELLQPVTSSFKGIQRGIFMYDVSYKETGRHRVFFYQEKEASWQQIATIDLKANGCDDMVRILLAQDK